MMRGVAVFQGVGSRLSLPRWVVVGVVLCLVGLQGARPACADTADQQWEFASGLYAQKLWSLAAENLRKFIEAYPQDAHAKLAAYQLGAALYRATGDKGQIDFKAAAAAYESAIAKYPDPKMVPVAQYELGDAYYNLKQYDRVLTVYRAFLQGNPAADQAAEAQYEIAESLESLKKTADARAAYQLVVTKYPTSRPAPYALLAVGVMADDAGDDAAAVTAFQGILQRYGQSDVAAEARVRMGNSLLDLNRYQAASDAFTAALADPNAKDWKGDALLGLADARFGLKDWAGAATAYNNALAALAADDTRRSAMALRQADAFFNAKDYQHAVDAYTPLAAGTDATIVPNALYYKAASLRALNKFPEAAAAYQMLLDKYPNHALAPKAALRLGDTYADAKDPVKAAQAYRLVLTRYAKSDSVKDAQQALTDLVGEVGAGSGTDNAANAAQSQQLEGVLRDLPPGPATSNARLRLAQVSYQNGKYSDAARLAQAALDSKPDAATVKSALYLLASSQAQANNPAQAAQTFSRLIALDPRGTLAPQARLGLTWALLDAKKPTEAATAARAALAAMPANPPKGIGEQTRLALGEALLDTKQFKDAAAAFTPVAGSADKDFAAQGVYGSALALEGQAQWSAAATYWGKYAVLSADVPTKARASLRQGLALVKSKNGAAALAAFDRATAADSKGEVGMRALYESAWLAHDLKQPTQELARWQQLTQSDSPYTAEAWFQLGESQFAAKSWDAAATSYRTVTDHYAKSDAAPLAWYKLGSALYNQQKWTDAAAAFDQSAALKSSVSLESSFWAGESLNRADDLAHAQSRYQSFIAGATAATVPKGLAQYLPAARLGLGKALLASGDAAGAARVLEAAQPNAPADIAPEAAFQLGAALAKQQKWKEAATQFLKVATLYAGTTWAPRAQWEAAQATEQGGDKQTALALYQALGARQPADEWTLKAQQRLKELGGTPNA